MTSWIRAVVSALARWGRAALFALLLVPMAFVTLGYVDIQRGQVDFSAKERDGVAHLKPVLNLLASTVAARSQAVASATSVHPDLSPQISEVEVVSARYGSSLKTSVLWSTARSELRRATAAAKPREAYDAYALASTFLQRLIVRISEESNLRLDPDLDSCYLMDVLVFRLPVLLDLTGQVVDQATLASMRINDTQTMRLVLARASGSMRIMQNAVDAGMVTALSATRRDELRALGPALSAEQQAVAASMNLVDGAVETSRAALVTPQLGADARTALVHLIDKLVPQLDALLATRIDALQFKAAKVQAAALLAVLMVGYLMYKSSQVMAERRRAQLQAALIRHAANAANEADTVAAAAAIVLREICTRLGWVAGHAWTVAGDPATWYVSVHPDHDTPQCRLHQLAGEDFTPCTDRLPLHARSRLVTSAAGLADLGLPEGACGIGTVVAVPVLAGGGEVSGMLAFYLAAGASAPTADLIVTLEQIGLTLGRVVERQRTAATLIHQANHDPVTDVANRRRLLQEISTVQHDLAAGRGGDLYSAVLLVNLDRFRLVNDSLGYAAGDQVLRTAAERINRVVDETDLVARLGADEFVILARRPAAGSVDALELFTALARQVMTGLRMTINVVGHQIALRSSVGICAIADGGAAAHYPTGVLRDADEALRQAKRLGKDQVQVFDAAARGSAAARIADEAALNAAINSGQLLLHYQPIIALDDRQPVSVEALVRWQRPGHGMVPPNQFIPLAEESGLIVEVGRWVLRQACVDAAGWARTAPALAEATVSVNASTRQLTHPRFLIDVDQALAESGLSPDRLVIEVTETALIEDAEAVMSTLRAIRDRGIQLALDDFGTGYSSLSYVQNLPVTILKIDKSFVDPITGPGEGTALCEVVLKLAQATNLKTVAEGVENEAQAEALQRLGCHRGQGYVWSRPVPNSELIAAIATLVPVRGDAAPAIA